MMRTFSILLASVSSLGLVGCIGMGSEDKKKLAGACEGQAVEGAGSYQGGAEGFMPFEQKEPGETFGYSVDGVHFKLHRASSLAETHTVFCLEPVEEVEQGQCAFETVEGIGVAGIPVVDLSRSKGPTFPRVGMKRKGRLVDPSTGETVAEHLVEVPAPKCEGTFGEPTESAFRALEPTGISFADWTLGQLGVEG